MKEKDANKIMTELQKNYNLVSSSFARSRDRLWPEVKFLFDRAEKNEKVLDLGCGNGRFSQYLQHTDYTGVDFSEKMIEEARQRFSDKRFLVGNVLNLPFEKESFDKVYSIAVLHHIPLGSYRVNAFFEIARVLKPGGFLFLTTWNMWKTHRALCIRSNLVNFFSSSKGGRDLFLKERRYYYLFKRNELSSLAEEAGLEVEREGEFMRGRFSNFYLVAKKSNHSH